MQNSLKVPQTVQTAVRRHCLLDAQNPVLCMVSGGSDSVALLSLMLHLQKEGMAGPLAVFHVNHCLRGAASDADEAFVQELATRAALPFKAVRIDVAGMLEEQGGNLEALAREERYRAAQEELACFCESLGVAFELGKLATGHTLDDRVETFYMRSLVGTGPGGFRAMRYSNGNVVRPLLDCARSELRDYLRSSAGSNAVRAADGNVSFWREDKSNASADTLRGFVRHRLVPLLREKNAALYPTLLRSMNLIADEDDFLETLCQTLAERYVRWEDGRAPSLGCVLLPGLGKEAYVLQRRVAAAVLKDMRGPDARIENAWVEEVLGAWQQKGSAAEGGFIKSGYVKNIGGNIMVSANKRGVRLEPASAYRARRKRNLS